MDQTVADQTAACYLCGGHSLELVRDRLRYAITRRVLLCSNCGLNFLEPNDRDLGEYYADQYRAEYGPRPAISSDSQDIFEMYKPLQAPRIERLRKYLPEKGALLDIGASAGHFLAMAAPHVGECVAIELNRRDAEFIAKHLGFRVYTTPIEETDLPRGYFDLVTCFHTLEHISDPRAFLETVREYISPHGRVYIEVPNVDDALISVYQVEGYADFWYREPHLYNFSPETLRMLLSQAGFVEEAMFPVQRYGLLNHLHWVSTGEPQESAEVAMGTPQFMSSSHADTGELNAFLTKVDADYRQLLEKEMITESIGFLGRPRR